MKKKSLLFIGNFLSSIVGTRSVGAELSIHLTRQGWNILETSHQVNKPLRLADMVFSVLAYRRYYDAAYVDVFSGLAFSWAEVVTYLLSLLHKPVVLTLHGGGLVDFAQKHPRRVARLLKTGQSVVTPSRFLQDGLKQYCSEIGYMPNALETHEYPFQVCQNPGPKLVWLRAFHKIYQPEMAVRVLALLKQEFTNAKLTMAGPDKKDGSLESVLQLAQKLGVSADLDVVGPISKAEVPVWLARGDIFLNTTRYESFGVSVLEAALIGLPIVTTSVGELPYLWRHGHDALLVPSGNSIEMAHAISRILEEPDLATRLSINARRKAEQFDWAVIVPQWESLLCEVLSNPVLKGRRS